jgi:hypothetical protein
MPGTLLSAVKAVPFRCFPETGKNLEKRRAEDIIKPSGKAGGKQNNESNDT